MTYKAVIGYNTEKQKYSVTLYESWYYFFSSKKIILFAKIDDVINYLNTNFDGHPEIDISQNQKKYTDLRKLTLLKHNKNV